MAHWSCKLLKFMMLTFFVAEFNVSPIPAIKNVSIRKIKPTL